jgi:hypothetical protein
MREAENIAEVEALGIDLMGFICWSKSPRCQCYGRGDSGTGEDTESQRHTVAR